MKDKIIPKFTALNPAIRDDPELSNLVTKILDEGYDEYGEMMETVIIRRAEKAAKKAAREAQKKAGGGAAPADGAAAPAEGGGVVLTLLLKRQLPSNRKR